MTQGRPHEKTADVARLYRKISRRADTLHILVLLLKRQAQARGDRETADLIAYTLDHATEGDTIKLYLMGLMDKQ